MNPPTAVTQALTPEPDDPTASTPEPADAPAGVEPDGPTASATAPEPDDAPTGLLLRAGLRLVMAVVVLGAMFFLPAGTWRYWPAWIYCGALLGPMVAMAAYLYLRDPGLMARRMKMRERQATQKKVIALSGVVFYGGLLLPGFDFRFGWSQVPMAVVLAANAVVVLGMGLFFWVLRTNSYAARTIEVEAGQTVVSTGPYAHVRHPMYAAVIPVMLASPLALGSLLAVLPMLLVVPLLVVRILDEEQMLRRELPGYPEYCDRVRWRLVPGLW
ncbi:MAG: isoprenylcysteine carboxylmethyltransferase family protein [Myxococcales bacterium]|nr:isoprenylcysteine carboxylmethyltransferase family protein [Myxococcales bacterium]